MYNVPQFSFLDSKVIEQFEIGAPNSIYRFLFFDEIVNFLPLISSSRFSGGVFDIFGSTGCIVALRLFRLHDRINVVDSKIQIKVTIYVCNSA